MPFLDGKPVIITKRNVDEHGNPISVKQIETKQVSAIHNAIPLNYSIDRNHPIVITGFHQIYNQDEISANTFFADYDQGILYFHSSQVGKSLTIVYMSVGYMLISSNRIYRYNKTDGTYSNTSIEASFEKIENMLNTVITGGGSLDATRAEVVAARTDADGKTYPSLGGRLDDITAQLNNLNTIYRYERKIDVGTPTNTVNIGIAEYNPKTDIVNVYLSGVRMIEDVDFTVDRTNKTISSLKGNWINQDQLYIEVLQKANDGRGVSNTFKIDSKNVVLTEPAFNATDVQTAFTQTEARLGAKADKTELAKYLPLTGGTVGGNLTVTGNINGNAATATKLQTAKTINGVAFDGSQNINIGVSSGGSVTLGGYSKPNSGGNVTNTDTLNAAIGKLEVNIDGKANINHNQGSNTVTTMTNYQKGNNTGTITTNDSLNIAIAKLENGLDGKANANHNHNSSYLSLAGGTVNGNLTINGTLTANITGNSSTATKLQNTRNIQIGNSTKQFDGSQNLNYTLNDIGAAAINHGKHISDTCESITDWNSAVTNGWYMGNGAANSPTTGAWYFGEVITHNTNYVIQTVYAFTQSSDAKSINKYIRAKTNGVWGAWTNVTVSKAVPSNAVFTDTWRGIQNNLTSDSTTESLSAAQGKVLKGLVDGKASLNHNHNNAYLQLSGGTIQSGNFGALTIERTGSTNASAIYFKNGNGILGAVGMTGSVNDGLVRWTNDLSNSYVLLDSGNYKNTVTPANIGAATTNHTHSNYLPTSGGSINGNLSVTGNISGNLSGNSSTASKLQTARTINLTGGVTGTTTFDGSGNVSIATTVANMASNKITTMTGYSKASSVSAITQNDSLNTAIGKLEKAIESKSSTTVSNVTLTETIVEKTIQANSTTLTIGQTINTNDVVRVYLDGIRLFEGKTYTLTRGANAQITMSTGLNLRTGDIVTFEIARVTLT